MSSSASWTCPTCDRQRRSRFCPTCGEQQLRPRDLSLSDLAAQFAKGLSSIDGKLLRSFRSVLAAPGALSTAHIRGARRNYVGPLALFFVANALFVALQAATGTNVLSSPLDSHLNVQDWAPLARDMVASRLESRPVSLSAYAADFNAAAAFNAKALMILMVLALTPVLAAMFYRRHRTAGAHVVFALHLYTFVLVLLCFSLLIAEAEHLVGGDGLKSPVVDVLLSLFNVAACAAYIFMAIKPVYGAHGVPRAVQAITLALTVGALFVGYRFAIFLITFYTT